MTCCIKTPCKCSHCSSWPSPANGILLHGVQKPRARLGSSVMLRGMTRLHGDKARLETSLHYSPPGRLEAGPFQLLLLGNLKDCQPTGLWRLMGHACCAPHPPPGTRHPDISSGGYRFRSPYGAASMRRVHPGSQSKRRFPYKLAHRMQESCAPRQKNRMRAEQLPVRIGSARNFRVMIGPMLDSHPTHR